MWRHDLVWSLMEVCCKPDAEGASKVGDDVKNVGALGWEWPHVREARKRPWLVGKGRPVALGLLGAVVGLQNGHK